MFSLLTSLAPLTTACCLLLSLSDTSITWALAWKFTFPEMAIINVTSDTVQIMVAPDADTLPNNSSKVHMIAKMLSEPIPGGCAIKERKIIANFPIKTTIYNLTGLCPDTWYGVCHDYKIPMPGDNGGGDENGNNALQSGSCYLKKTLTRDGRLDSTLAKPLAFQELSGNRIRVTFGTPSPLPITVIGGFKRDGIELSRYADPNTMTFDLVYDTTGSEFASATQEERASTKSSRTFCYTWEYQSPLIRYMNFVTTLGFASSEKTCGTYAIQPLRQNPGESNNRLEVKNDETTTANPGVILDENDSSWTRDTDTKQVPKGAGSPIQRVHQFTQYIVFIFTTLHVFV